MAWNRGLQPESLMSRNGLFAAIVACACIVPSVRGATPRQVDTSIKRGVEWLYEQQNDKGNWETTPGPGADFKKEQSKPESGQWGGVSAMATYALLDAGESPKDERIAKAVQFLN